MTMHKKIRISSVKRGHHKKHKKNAADSGKKVSKVIKTETNIFSKKYKIKPQANVRQKNKIKHSLPILDTVDVGDMINSTDESDAELEKTQKSDYDEMKHSSEQIENAYHSELQNKHYSSNKTKQLLPIKTHKDGIISRSANVYESTAELVTSEESRSIKHEDSGSETQPNEVKVPMGISDLLVERNNEIEKQKYIIGSTCASIVENPELKIKSLTLLLDLIGEKTQCGRVNMFVIRKLALISLKEVFKDIVPDYRLGIIDANSQKLKKTTLARVNYEKELLLHYKNFLILCEECTRVLNSKNSGWDEKSLEREQIAEIAVQCICDLLIAHPYFNYSLNKAQMLVVMLNNNREAIRKAVHVCFVATFKTDNRYDMSIHIVRHINQLVKKKQYNVYPEMVSCLKFLRIKEVNVDAQKEKELKLKKLEAHKSRVINMSRQERKRKKKLQELEKELFETKAEESKQNQLKKLTDLTKLVFIILFRILKTAPKSKLLSVTLEVLSKFAHTINIDFFSDLIDVLDNLLVHAGLGNREQLHCIQTVFTILKGQGEVLNIDPARFYTHLYKNLLYINAAKKSDDIEPIISALESVLLKRHNNITYHRYLAFIKRIAMITLQLQHSGALGCLGVIRTGFVLNSTLDVLLDTESAIGSGEYNSEIDEPEFSNASSTSLYEVASLNRHYHPIVRKLANNISNSVPSAGPGVLPPALGKLTPIELYAKHDTTHMEFNPGIPSPKEKNQLPETARHIFSDQHLESFCFKQKYVQRKEAEFNFMESC
ncbi:nucleolar complex protein 3 homolog [Sabethes cyaneus]|uniref:nucleolar complex protein 3 homolog n=1 Tax=Sabethes cyaneus TaxID=53552 RepID=UPI00237EDE9E|nr:nucleolar complex protein 3 homolog [Sabethes cyaneus]